MAEQQKVGFKTVIACQDQAFGIGAYGSVCTEAQCDLCENLRALKETGIYKDTRERQGDSGDTEHEQIQTLQRNLDEKCHMIDQKDALIAEREQQLEQCQMELTKQIEFQNWTFQQHKQQIQEKSEQILIQNQENQQQKQEIKKLKNQLDQRLEMEEDEEIESKKQSWHVEESESLIAYFIEEDTKTENLQSKNQRLWQKLKDVIDQKDAQIAEREEQLKQSKEKLTQQNDLQNSKLHEYEQQIQQQSEEIQQLNHEIQQQNQKIQQLNHEIQQQNQEINELKNQLTQELEVERNEEIQETEEEEQREEVNQELEENETTENEPLMVYFDKENIEIEEELSTKNQTQDGANITLNWREGEIKAPCEMGRYYCDAVVHQDTAYYRYDVDNSIYAYHIPTSSWSPIPECPIEGGSTITIIDGQLTMIGGYRHDGKKTNKLFSLTGNGSDSVWTEEFPPMPTKRYNVAALCTGTAVIVAGGHDDNDKVIKTVELLITEIQQWHTAPDLPEPLARSSLILCGDIVYLFGGVNKQDVNTKSVYSRPLISVLLSIVSKSLGGRLLSLLMPSWTIRGRIWKRIADLPATSSANVALHGQLFAIGGNDGDKKPTSTVHVYEPNTDSWEVIGHTIVPRRCCLAAVVPDNQLMVVGGWTTDDSFCDSIEFGKVL